MPSCSVNLWPIFSHKDRRKIMKTCDKQSKISKFTSGTSRTGMRVVISMVLNSISPKMKIWNWSISVKKQLLLVVLSHPTRKYLHREQLYLFVLFQTWVGQREGFQLLIVNVQVFYIWGAICNRKCMCRYIVEFCVHIIFSWWSKVTMRHYGFFVVS